MTAAREQVLARLRSALGDAPPAPPAARRHRTAGEHPPGSPVLLDLLAERLEEYRAVVHRAPVDRVAQAVAAALAGAERPRVVVPDGLPPGWLAETHAERVADDDLTAHELDRLDGVVTSAAVAIAETATVVLDGGPGQGRRALTLVPDLHVCVVTAEQVVQTVPEAVARLDPARPLTWVSGPSATSDIELVRVEGVHGPRRLHVVLAADRLRHRDQGDADVELPPRAAAPGRCRRRPRAPPR